MQNFKRNIILTVLFGFIFYLLFILYSNFDSVYFSIKNFPNTNFILAIVFSIFAILTKFYRWHYLLNKNKIIIGIKDSFLIFCSGLIMGITPGKLGELFKSYMLKKDYEIELNKSIPIIFAERISEFLTLVLLGIVSLLFYSQFQTYLIFLVIFLIVSIYFLSNQKGFNFVLKKLEKFSFIKDNREIIDSVFANQKILKTPKIHIISIFAWIFEFFCFYIILCNFISDISIVKATTIYSVAILFGSISMFPGGLGTTESSLTYLLIQNGLMQSGAAAITILIRAFTLMFSILVGTVSITIYYFGLAKKGQK